MQVQSFPGYPQLDEPQLRVSLEAYIIWLMGKVMFTENHVTTIAARYIPIAREIAMATGPEDIRQRSWGSVVLAATYRGMCNACQLSETKSAILGCPLFLQLWSWERFSIERPSIDFGPFSITEIDDGDFIDKPTFATLYTRRLVCLWLFFNESRTKQRRYSTLQLTCFFLCRDGILLTRQSNATRPLPSSSICTLRLSGSRTRPKRSTVDTPAAFLFCAIEIKRGLTG